MPERKEIREEGGGGGGISIKRCTRSIVRLYIDIPQLTFCFVSNDINTNSGDIRV